MATVPRLTGPSVSLQGAPNFRQSNPVSADLLSIGARQAQQAGAALTSLGGEMMAREKQAVDQANALRVDDALNQATEAALRLQHDQKDGYMAAKGADALNRQSGMSLADEYTGKLDSTLSTLASGLSNEDQRRLFAMKANNLRTSFLGQATAYQRGQFQDYTLSVREAAVPNATNALVLNFSDPTNVQQQVTRLRAAYEGGVDENGTFVPGMAQMQGKSAAWGKEEADKAVSSAHLGAIQAAMQAGNLNGAMAYRKKYAEQITAGDMLKIDGTLQQNYDTALGARIGGEIVAGTASAVNPGPFDRFANIVGEQGAFTNAIMQTESGGRRFGKDGKLLEGPPTRYGTAKGEMQVLDGTAKAPGLGVRPAQDESPEERARVGRDYLGALVKRYDGDLTKAAAAYNWGYGNVDKAIKAAEQNAGKGETVANDAWLASAPKETRDYVAKVSTQMQSPTGGVPQRPTLESLHQQARARLGPNASPAAIKAATDTVTQRFEDQTKAIQQRKDETVAQAMQALTQNGGRYSELPASIRSSLTLNAPEKIDEVMNFGKRVSSGDDTTDNALYLKLTDPATLKGLSDAQFYQLRSRLSQSDFQHFANKRQEAIKGSPGNQPGDLNDGAINRTLNSRLAGLGIDPTLKDGTSDAERLGAIRRFVDSSLIDAQNAVGKKFNDAEVQAHIDGLFAKSVTFRTSFLGFSTGSTGQSLLSMKVGDIPGDQKDRIKAAFKAQGVSNPTDGQILGAFFAAHAQTAQRNPSRTGTF